MTQNHTKPWTLLVISGTWPPLPCGVGDYSSKLCEHLVRLGIRVQVLTSKHARPDFYLAGESLLEVHTRIDRWSWPALRIVEQTVRETKPDFILFQWPTANYGRSLAVNFLPGILKKKFPEIPLLTTLHEFRYFRPWTQMRVIPALRYSDRVILVDPQDGENIKKKHTWVSARLRFIPIGSNVPPVAASFDRGQQRTVLGIQPKDFVVAFFGFANPPKGLETLFSAIRLLREKYPYVKLLLLPQLSSQVKYHQHLLQQLKKLDLIDHTIQLEYARPRLAAEILAGADCAVLPFADGASLKRGSMLACLEQALPVITTIPKQKKYFPFLDRKHMLLVPPGDVTAIIQAVEMLLQEPKLKKALSEQLREPLRAYAWDTIAKQHCALLAELQEGGR